LITDREGLYIDGTLGLGGHSKILLSSLGTKAKIFGFDKDEKAITMARENVADSRLETFNLSYTECARVLREKDIQGVNGILFDFGLSSYQLDDASRGFSFNKQGPLDMRFDTAQTLTAQEIVNTWPADKIEEILLNYGEEKFASKIAQAIALAAREAPLETTWQLAKIIERVCPRTSKTHPATRTFQALRIAVNDEFGAVKKAPKLLKEVLLPLGRAAFLTFHSLEDRIIKVALKDLCQDKDTWRLVNKKVIEPSWQEIKQNPRARSAKLRIIERLK
ncbi:MAG: 16S rRNA (cytosine(1402)-N(4))-methyltransferase RsmH, partial [Campylobacter sp.]|nr:16S rRNA (cytosine(1402)-N(4))-methyltransferase RsmH [Campylobacter sp.]